jgi:DNA-directed RNA polymerase subunit RPC12/RpoP
MNNNPFFQEISDDDVICPYCEYETNIGALIGETTDNCPACGGRILYPLEITE